MIQISGERAGNVQPFISKKYDNFFIIARGMEKKDIILCCVLFHVRITIHSRVAVCLHILDVLHGFPCVLPKVLLKIPTSL